MYLKDKGEGFANGDQPHLHPRASFPLVKAVGRNGTQSPREDLYPLPPPNQGGDNMHKRILHDIHFWEQPQPQ